MNHNYRSLLHLHCVAQFSVGIIQPIWLWAVLGYYTMPCWLESHITDSFDVRAL